MTTARFRTFLIGSLVAALIAVVMDFMLQSRMPPDLDRALNSVYDKIPVWKLIAGTVVATIAVIAAVISTFGMLAFKRWAPGLGVNATIGGTLALTLIGPTVDFSGASALSYLSTVLWGCALSVAHTPFYMDVQRRSKESGLGA